MTPADRTVITPEEARVELTCEGCAYCRTHNGALRCMSTTDRRALTGLRLRTPAWCPERPAALLALGRRLVADGETARAMIGATDDEREAVARTLADLVAAEPPPPPSWQARAAANNAARPAMLRAFDADPRNAHLLGKGCHAGWDGECNWNECPQERDGEPEKSGRHCPLDRREEEA